MKKKIGCRLSHTWQPACCENVNTRSAFFSLFENANFLFHTRKVRNLCFLFPDHERLPFVLLQMRERVELLLRDQQLNADHRLANRPEASMCLDFGADKKTFARPRNATDKY